MSSQSDIERKRNKRRIYAQNARMDKMEQQMAIQMRLQNMIDENTELKQKINNLRSQSNALAEFLKEYLRSNSSSISQSSSSRDDDFKSLPVEIIEEFLSSLDDRSSIELFAHLADHAHKS